MRLCKPAIVYLVLSVIGLVIGYRMFSIIHILCILLWAFILQSLCSMGYPIVSWVLVLLPLVIMFGFIFAALGLTLTKSMY